MARFFNLTKSYNMTGEDDSLTRFKSQIQSLIGDTQNLRKSMATHLNGQIALQKNLRSSVTSLKTSPKYTNLSKYFESLSLTSNSQLQRIIASLEKKISLLNALNAKCTKLESLTTSRQRYQRKLAESQKRGDYDTVSKTSQNLGAINDDLKELELELTVKCEKISSIEDICELEVKVFKQYQVQRLKTSITTLDVDKEHFEEVLLEDEFLKFEMSLEAAVIQKKKEIANSTIEKDKHSMNALESTPTKKGKKQSLAFVPVYNTLVAGLKGRLSMSPKKSDNEMFEEKEETDVVEKYISLYDYTPQQDDEITLQEDDQLIVLGKNEDGWFLGKNVRSGEEGLFPGNYCKKE